MPTPSLFLHGCKTKAGVGRTGNEARDWVLASVSFVLGVGGQIFELLFVQCSILCIG